MFRKYQSNSKSDFRNDIPDYSDDKIIEILTHRDHYQPEAAKMAIEEAIKREIIYSEQDLFSGKYKVPELRRSVWPTITDNKIRTGLRKSIARSLFLCGLIPTIYGLIQSNLGNKIEGAIILLFGLLWMYISSHLIKSYNKIYVFLLLAGAILAAASIFVKLILDKHLVMMDYFLLAVLFMLLGYGLLFLKKMEESK